jgi:hypothetical protein
MASVTNAFLALKLRSHEHMEGLSKLRWQNVWCCFNLLELLYTPRKVALPRGAIFPDCLSAPYHMPAVKACLCMSIAAAVRKESYE